MFIVPVLHLVGLLLRVVHLSPFHLDLLHLQLEICVGLEEAAQVRMVSSCGGEGYSNQSSGRRWMCDGGWSRMEEGQN